MLSTQAAFSSSDLKEGTHPIMVSIYDGYTYTNQTVMVEVAAPAPAAGLGGSTFLYMAAAVAAIAVVGGIAFWALRRRKSRPPEALPPPR